MSESSNNRITNLVRVLTSATSDRRISWRVVDDSEFQYSGTESSVIIRSRDNDGEPPFELELFNSNGVSVESIETKFFRPSGGFGQGTREPAPWNEDLEELFKTARRNALNIDDVIDSLIRSIEPDPPF